MYLTSGLILNSGAIIRLSLIAPFHSDGRPKPIVLVGPNGSGKTEFLSIVADGLIEIAARHYDNITKSVGLGRRFFRILGGRSQRMGAPFELSLLKFHDGSNDFYYRAKAGSASSIVLSDDEKSVFSPITSWPSEDDKYVVGPTVEIERIFEEGAYVFFPSTRFELPYWANLDTLEREPEGDFTPSFAKALHKPIVVQSALRQLRPWIMNLMLDTIVNYSDIFSANNLQELKVKSALNITFMNTYSALNSVVQAILRNPRASVMWLNRAFGERRISIFAENAMVSPSLDSLSGGQGTLLSIFGTLLRYGDSRRVACRLDQIEGVALIDEADAHLHAELQHDALPELIRLFPRVQFIITAHSPLLPVGMRRAFGDDFAVVELPSGLTIDPERFSEFETSLAYFRATQAFEASVQALVAQGLKPLVLCEGETDPDYLVTAADLLGFHELVEKIEFHWVGQKGSGGAKGGGKDNLDNALKFLRYNPGLLKRHVVLLYDCDANKQHENYIDLFVRALPPNRENTLRRGGIENLLPESVFEERFFEEVGIMSGLDAGTIKRLRKVDLCYFLCKEKRDASDFEKFRIPLEQIRDVLINMSET